MTTRSRNHTPARAFAATLVLVVALGALAGCGSEAGTAPSNATTGSDGLTVSGAWARASASSSGNGAVYLTITNPGPTDDELIAVSVPAGVAGSAQVHETVEASHDMASHDMASGPAMEGSGMMTMHEVTSVPVPAGGAVTFEPGGHHVMLVDLVAPLTRGGAVPVTLAFAHGGPVTVEAEVRAP